MDTNQIIKDLGLIRARRKHYIWESFMRKYNCDVICEIGIRTGHNFLEMIRHNPSVAVAVDSWIDDGEIFRNDGGFSQLMLDQQYEDFSKSVADKPFVKIYREYSFDAVKHFENNYFDLIYIDGDHSYEGCLRDITDWYPKVKKGRFLVGDDYRGDVMRVKFKEHIKIRFGVIQAVQEFAKKNNLQFHLLPNCGWSIIKV